MKVARGSVVLLAFLAAGSARAEETVRLEVGGHRTVEVVGLARIASGDPTVCATAQSQPGKIELQGVATGRTLLIAWTAAGEERRYHIEVGKPPLEPVSGPGFGKPCPVPAKVNCERKLKAVEETRHLIKKEDFEAAAAAARKGLAEDPSAMQLHRLLASAFIDLIMPDQAVLEYEAFVRGCPDDPAAPKLREFLHKFGH